MTDVLNWNMPERALAATTGAIEHPRGQSLWERRLATSVRNSLAAQNVHYGMARDDNGGNQIAEHIGYTRGRKILR